MRRRWIVATAVIAAAAALVYLHNPPWMEDVTSGMRPWERDESGIPFRWTMGRASFYIPASSERMTVPLRSGVPGPDGAPVRVELRQEGALLGTVELTTPGVWVTPTLTLRPLPTSRPFRRIEFRVSRTFPPWSLGVMTGEVALH